MNEYTIQTIESCIDCVHFSFFRLFFCKTALPVMGPKIILRPKGTKSAESRHAQLNLSCPMKWADKEEEEEVLGSQKFWAKGEKTSFFSCF
jgi:hypothetical protein